MSASAWYWLFYVLWFLLSVVHYWGPAPADRGYWTYLPAGGSLLLAVLLFIIGWHSFGGPIK